MVQKRFHDLVVSTYGRGIYILDDITPLEQMATWRGLGYLGLAIRAAPGHAHCRRRTRLREFQLKNPPRGAVEAAILDADGKVVRELRAANSRPGLNRIPWDLHYDPPHLVALRTTPPENPHIWEEPRFRGADSRPITHWGAAQAQVGPVAAPGKYTVRLTVDGESYTQPLKSCAIPAAPGRMPISPIRSSFNCAFATTSIPPPEW